MELKLVLLIFFGVSAVLIILTRKNPVKSLFWFGVLSLFVRELSMPIIDSINLGFFIFTILVVLVPSILFSKENFKEWRPWFLVLLIGSVNTLLFGQSNEYFIDQDVIFKAFDWSSKFLVVVFIASSIIHFVKTKEDLNKLLNLFLLSCFIFSFTAVIAYFGFYDGLVIYGAGSLNDGFIQDLSRDIIHSEIYGIGSSNLVFGVSSIGVLFLPYLDWKVWKKYLFLLLIAFSVIISLKRVAILSLVFSLLYFFIIEKKKGNHLWLLVIPLIILLMGTSYYDLIFKRFFGAYGSLTQIAVTDNSSEIRIDRLNLAWETFLKNPLIGQGAGYLTFIHNGFLEVLGNLGLLGLVFFKPIVKPLKNIKNYFYNPWAIALIILMITLITFEAAINRTEIMYFLGLLYGGFLVSTKLITNKNNE